MEITITYANDEMYWVDKLRVKNDFEELDGIIDLSFDDPCDIIVKRYPKTNKLSVTYLDPNPVGIGGTEEDWYFYMCKENGGECFLPEEYNKEEYGKIDAKVTFKTVCGMGENKETFHVKNNQ